MKRKFTTLTFLSLFVLTVMGILLTYSNKSSTVAAAGTNIVSTTYPAHLQTPIEDTAPNTPPMPATVGIHNNVGVASGVAAIKPSKVVNNLADDVTAQNFTEADVRSYFATHLLPGFTYNRSKTTIARVEFVTRKEVNARAKGDSLNLPDNKQLCYVTLIGNFNSIASPATFKKIYVVFDAANGNFILAGEAV